MAEKAITTNGNVGEETAKEKIDGDHVIPTPAAPRYVEETDDVLLDVGAAKLEDGSLGGLKLAKDGHVCTSTFLEILVLILISS